VTICFDYLVFCLVFVCLVFGMWAAKICFDVVDLLAQYLTRWRRVLVVSGARSVAPTTT
jgi:hypothetical protein